MHRIVSSLAFVMTTVAACVALAFSADPAQADAKKAVSRNVHVFYYPWYGNPEVDKAWSHWNEGGHKPPEDIGANFYPELGLYSSNDPRDLNVQMRQLREAGIGVLCTSWWGPGSYTDKATPKVLDAADRFGLKVNFHLEPWTGRKGVKAKSYRDGVVYILDKYGKHRALYRDPKRGNKPMFYVYDSYLVKTEDWATVLAPDGKQTIRGTDYDGIIIGLWVKKDDSQAMLGGGFDGFYTYFATNGFTYGSTIMNWPAMARFATKHKMLFIPSVGPGYDDTRIRPWNTKNQRDREKGAYYDRMWAAALGCKTEFVSITSFNEWHEGTQIEPSVPKKIDGYTYLDFRPRTPDHYLKRTHYWVKRLEIMKDE